MRPSFFMLLALLPLAACAKSADKVIAPTYVSPMQYEALNCRQLAGEAQRASTRAAALKAASASEDRQKNAPELSRLQGEMEAIEVASSLKRCGPQIQSAPPPM
jgi:hypothetical protein